MITTVVGNYPKIPSLGGGPNIRQAIARHDEGRITDQELAQLFDEATVDAIQEQAQAGIDLITDGHIRWDDGQTYLAAKLGGFSINGLIRYFDSNTYYRQPMVEGDVVWKSPILVRDLKFAVEASPVPVKVALPGPFTLASLSSNQHYQEQKTLVMDLAAALNQEAMSLEAAGATFVQFDEPSLLKAKSQFPLFQEASRVLTQGLTAKTALYTYFGDVSGMVPQLFSLPFQVFGLDFVTGPNNFPLVAGLPSDKELALGILDARNTKMESVDEIVEAVRRVKQHVGLDRMYINPSCGLDFLPRRNAYNKLVRLVEGAKRAQEVLS
ncbi:MAG: hypothetical protein HW403_687 [Dehalococcoidia bacterium]|nr:hypothetical protein [Dehalococcoidia bacterium]